MDTSSLLVVVAIIVGVIIAVAFVIAVLAMSFKGWNVHTDLRALRANVLELKAQVTQAQILLDSTYVAVSANLGASPSKETLDAIVELNRLRASAIESMASSSFDLSA